MISNVTATPSQALPAVQAASVPMVQFAGKKKNNQPPQDGFKSSRPAATDKAPSALDKQLSRMRAYVAGLMMALTGVSGGGLYTANKLHQETQELRAQQSEIAARQAGQVSPEVINQLAPHNVTISGPLGLIGSGTWMKIGGHTVIVTNAHVANPAYADSQGEFEVGLYTGSDFDQAPPSVKAEIISRDDAKDVAILRVTTPDFKPPVVLDFDDASQVRDLKAEPLQVGEQIFVVGNPAGLNHSVSSGIVSRVGRPNPWNETQADIQVDAPINGGNSGGAAYDAHGRYIGIPSWGLRNSDGLGAVVSVDTVRELVDASWWAQKSSD